MSDLNQCNFIGRLGADPETRYMPDGTAVCNFQMAVGWKSKEKEGAEWIRVTAFKGLADICGKYLQKGTQVFISGRMRTRKWQGDDGKDKYTTEIVAETMQMLARPRSTEQGGATPSGAPPNRTESAAGAPAGNSKPAGDFDDFESDVPF